MAKTTTTDTVIFLKFPGALINTDLMASLYTQGVPDEHGVIIGYRLFAATLWGAAASVDEVTYSSRETALAAAAAYVQQAGSTVIPIV